MKLGRSLVIAAGLILSALTVPTMSAYAQVDSSAEQRAARAGNLTPEVVRAALRQDRADLILVRDYLIGDGAKSEEMTGRAVRLIEG